MNEICNENTSTEFILSEVEMLSVTPLIITFVSLRLSKTLNCVSLSGVEDLSNNRQ